MADPIDNIFAQRLRAAQEAPAAAPATGTGNIFAQRLSGAPEAAPAAPPQTAPQPQTGGFDPKDVAGSWFRSHFPNGIDEGENSYDLADVPGQFIRNFLPDAKQFISGLADAASGAASYIWNNPKDALSELQYAPGHLIKAGDTILADLVKHYGSWEAAKRTAAEHPVQFLTDIMQFVPVSKLGAIGKAAEIADPAKAVNNVISAAKKSPQLALAAADNGVQVLEGIGSGALKELIESGKTITPDTWKTLTKGLDFDKSYDLISNSLKTLVQDSKLAYDTDMMKIQQANQPLSPQSIARIKQSLDDAMNIGKYKAPGAAKAFEYGQDPSLKAAQARIKKLVDDWMADPAYHTPYGADKLKQAVYDVADHLDVLSPNPARASKGSAFAGKVSNAVKDEIINAAPEYGGMMERASSRIKEFQQLEKEFSLGNENKLATLRKLQKVWRQSADVAHGERTNILREAVEKSGHPELMSHLAAGQFHPWTPRGLRGAFIPAAIMTGGITPLLAAGMSPRIVGTAAYGLGRGLGSPVGRGAGRALNSAFDFTQAVSPTMIRAGSHLQGDEGYRRGGFFS